MDKKEYLQAIGVYPLISLKEARKRATESRSLIANGINPVEEARKEKAIDALNMAAGFKTVAEDWLATRVSGWSESYTKQVRSALEKDVYPVLGKRSIVDITARDVLALLQKKERTDQTGNSSKAAYSQVQTVPSHDAQQAEVTTQASLSPPPTTANHPDSAKFERSATLNAINTHKRHTCLPENFTASQRVLDTLKSMRFH